MPRRILVSDLLLCLRTTALAAISVAISGCVLFRPDLAMGPVNKMIPPLPDHCNAAALADTIDQDFTTLADRPTPRSLRILWPGQEVSGDLDSTRLNAQVDALGKIKRLFCG